jgi:N-acetylmuramoyl-L-alanine amidase
LLIDFIPTIPIPKPSITEKKKWELDVIVLDPGHGGEDAGALSINGYKEKDIALAIAKKVKDQLKEVMPSTRVIMTRTDDTFIELYRRGHIANQYKGKLFISIHCNSMPTKPHPANGCESYILRPGRNSEAVRVAEKENGSIKLEKEQSSYENLNEEKLIVATMAQAAFVRFSERFAAVLQKNVAKNTKMYNRGVNQAGFLVLVGASMPNVLFETGFLSNSTDEKILISDAGHNNIAEGIVKAIITYSDDIIGNTH